MNQNLTDITIVVDRSGSMSSCRDDAQGGINQFIEDQKKEQGEANFTLVQFDTVYEFVHKGVPIKDVDKYVLNPRGSTALLDAVGRAVVETGERLSKMNEADRPACVAFVIVTDGQENSSVEYKKDQVRDMIRTQREQYNWKFMFLGADDSAFAQAAEMGIPIAAAAVYDPAVAGVAYSRTSKKVAMMRGAAIKGQSLHAMDEFTSEERADLKNEKK